MSVCNNLIFIIGSRSTTERYLISVDFWNPTRTNKIKRPKELSSANSGLRRVPILVKRFSTGGFAVPVIIEIEHFGLCGPAIGSETRLKSCDLLVK